MKQRGLAGIIKPQKQDLSFLLPQSERCENSIEPIEQKHDFKQLIYLRSKQLTPQIPDDLLNSEPDRTICERRGSQTLD